MATTILNHSDEVSGTTIFDNGTKVYWTEGRSSRVAVLDSNGLYSLQASSQHPILEEEQRIEEGADDYREMTPDEEAEWAKAREDAHAD